MTRLVAALAAAPLALTLLAAPGVAGSTADRTHAQQAPKRVFDVSDLETGDPPQVPWAEQTSAGRVTIHGPAGDTPAAGNLREFAPMGSGYVVQGGQSPKVRWIGADGSPGPRVWRSGFGLAVSGGGKAVAFTGRRGQVRVMDSEGDRVLRMPSVPGKQGFNSPAAVFGEDCKESEISNGCAIMINSNRQLVSWVTSSHGIVDTTEFETVTAGLGRWLGGIVSRDDFGTCSDMRRGLRVRWTTCRNQLSAISPDRQLLVGSPAFSDGFGPTRLDLLDLRTGDREQSWTAHRRGRSATYFDQIWEDPDHLLVVTFQEGEWAVVRLGTDGSMEYAVAPRADDGDMAEPLFLPAG